MDESHKSNDFSPYKIPDTSSPVVVTQPFPLPICTSSNVIQCSLEQILTGHERLTFHASEKLGMYSTHKFTYIRSNTQSQPLVMTITETEREQPRLCTLIIPFLLTFKDSSGKVLMICEGGGTDLTVKIDDRIIGNLRTNGKPCCYSFHSVLNSTNDLLFETVPQGSEFIFTSNGTTIASAGKDGDTFVLNIPVSLDIRTRAMIIIQSYYIFTWYFAETRYRCATGTVGLAKLFFGALLIFGICTILLVVLCIIFGGEGNRHRFRG